MKIALGNLKLGNTFSYEGKEYKASGMDSNKAVNSILCIAKDNSRIWLDTDTPVELSDMEEEYV